MPRSGLPRWGWAVIVASTAAAAVLALLASSGFAVGEVSGHSRTHADSIPATAPPQAPVVPPRAAAKAIPPPAVSAQPTVPVQPVSALATGDCLQAYTSPWAGGYPVVDCAAPHLAQVLSTGILPQASGTPFPGATALRDQVNTLCSSPGLVDWDWVWNWNEDVVTDARYPSTSAEWASGARSYYCFLYTSSHQELTGSAVPGH